MRLKILLFIFCCAMMPVRVHSQVTANFDFDQTCNYFQFENLSSASGSYEITGYLWDFGDLNTSTSINPDHTYQDLGDYTVALTVFYNNPTGQITYSEQVQYWNPLASFSAPPVCVGSTTYFTDQSTSPYATFINDWKWDLDNDGTFETFVQNPTYTYSSSGLKPVTLEVTNNLACTDDSVQTVLVDTLPVAFFTHDPACAGLQTCFTDASVPNADSLAAWYWNFGDGSISILQNPCHEYADTGYYVVSLVVTNSDGCISLPYEELVYVSVVPLAEFSSTTGCFGDTTYFTNLTSTFGVEIQSWLWEFGDPGSGANNTSALFQPSHYYTTPGSHPVTLTAMNIHGCADTRINTVLVDSLPEANFILPDTLSMEIQLVVTDLSVGHGSPIVNKVWDFGDGTVLVNVNPVIHTYAMPGKYIVCLSVEDFNGCTDVFCDTLVVTEILQAGFLYVADANNLASFTDISIPDGQVTNWFWNFGDLLTLADTAWGIPNPSYQYPASGWYDVYLRVYDNYGGMSDTTQTIFVGNAVVAEFEEIHFCLGDTTFFLDHSYSPIGANFEEWFWDFGDGSDSTYYFHIDTLKHRFPYPGVFSVTLILKTTLNGFLLTDTVTHNVEVVERPIVIIDTTQIGVCIGNPIQFHDISSYVPGDPPASWKWDFMDGGTAFVQNPTHLYADTGSYWVTLEVATSRGCYGIDSAEAHVVTAPKFTFQVENPCINSPAKFIPDYDSSIIKITEWNWNFGDNLSPNNTSTLQSPTHVYSRIDNYTITMNMSAFGCSGQAKKTILIYPIPFSDFEIVPNYQGVQGKTKFENASIYATNYLWDFGNGNTSTVPEPTEVYEYDSTYTITLIAYNEYTCSDTSRYQLKVLFRGLYFPTAFSPKNPIREIAYFTPKGVNLTEFLVQVFDMRGSLLWESDKLDENGSPAESWDGYADGVLMPQGMYVWKASGKFRDGSVWQGQSYQEGEALKTSGVVTLIH